MQVGSQTEAVLLLTVHFGKDNKKSVKPLSTGEWARFAQWLKEHELQPASLMTTDVASILSGLIDRSITARRVQQLLERGGALGLSLERWERAGLWVLTRSDPEYPERLKRRLRQASPPVLFGSGNKTLLNSGGIAVVGSRDASEESIAFAQTIGRNAASQGLSVVSGGAKGVDQSAMLGALEKKGTAIGVLADGLLRSATSSMYRRYLMSKDLVLVSSTSPEASFNVGNAMARNRYIYGLSDAAIVVSCTRDKGGTWTGAIENLKARWVPLWIKQTEDSDSGNSDLVRQGARWLSDPPATLSSLLNVITDLPETSAIESGLPLLTQDSSTPRTPSKVVATSALVSDPAPVRGADTTSSASAPSILIHAEPQPMSFYKIFLDRMLTVTAKKSLNVEELSAQLELTKQQVNAWLKRAVSEKAVKKSGRPSRYQRVGVKSDQQSLFSND